MTKHTLVAAVPFLAVLLAFAPVTHADSYDGPFCFEKPADFTGKQSDSSSYSKEQLAVRGTCKELSFQRVVSLDGSVSHYFFLPPNETATTSGPVTISGPYVGDFAIRYEMVDDMFGGMSFGHPIYLSDMAADDVLTDMSIASSGISFVDVYGRPTPIPYNRYYKASGGFYVPATSPVTKITEYWHIAPKANGFMLVKDRTEISLDDGTIKTLFNGPVEAATSTTATSSQSMSNVSWWSRLMGFFKGIL